MVGRSETAESSNSKRRGFKQTIDASGGESARESGVAVRRFEYQLDRRVVIRAELPNPMAKAIGASMQRVFLAGFAVELIGDPVKDKSAVRDAVGEPPRHSAERGRIGNVVVQSIETEHDPLQAVGGRHDKIAHHRAPCQNFSARPCPGRDRDLEHGRLVDLPKALCAHFVPPNRCDAARSHSQPKTGAWTSMRSSSARIEAKTWRNIASVSTPVLVL